MGSCGKVSLMDIGWYIDTVERENTRRDVGRCVEVLFTQEIAII